MRIELESTILTSIDYRFTTQTLQVFRADGRVQVFKEVPQEAIKGLILAISHGNYFLKNIRETYPLISEKNDVQKSDDSMSATA